MIMIIQLNKVLNSNIRFWGGQRKETLYADSVISYFS